jgi:hypothetical protein
MRIRTIKPEILTDEKSAALTDTAWRLFVSCIVMADDYGNFRASPAFLHSQVFWATTTYRDACANALETLARLSLVSLYEVGGQQYGHIVGWAKHQRVDHPGKPLCPRENQGNTVTCEESSRESQEDGANIPESLKPDRDRDRDLEGKGKGPTPAASGKIRPRTPHDLEHCLRVAIQREQPQAGLWIPGRFSTSDADKMIRDLGDIEAALPVLERKIDLFAKDPDMQPWTVAKFVDKFNGIGLAKLDFGRARKPSEEPTIWNKA